MLMKIVKQTDRKISNDARQYEKLLLIAERLEYNLEKMEAEFVHGEKEFEKCCKSTMHISYPEDPERKHCRKMVIKLAKYLDEMRDTCKFDLQEIKKFSIKYEDLVGKNALLVESLRNLDKITKEKERL